MRKFRRTLFRLSAITIVAVALLVAVLTWNTFRLKSRQIDVEPVAIVEFNEEQALQRFGDALKIPTISTPAAKLVPDSPLYQFSSYLEQVFPRLHEAPIVRYTGEDFGDPAIPSLMFEWPGEQPDLDAVLLMSHFDVVPVTFRPPSGDASPDAIASRQDGANDEFGQGDWSVPPFAGKIDEKFIWGRGSLDCKHGVLGILEAIDLLLAEGYRPSRTIYIALGHDEELGGTFGNGRMGEWLRQRGRRIEVVLDEGGCIFTEFPGLDRPAALIGIAEKGIATIDLEVSLDADQIGHASMPPADTSVTILAAAIDRIRRKPFPAEVEGVLEETLLFLGPEMSSLTSRAAMANLWISAPIVKRMLGQKVGGNAMMRTTVAATLLNVDNENDNVLPQRATATLNVRLMPGTSLQQAADYLRKVIADPRVTVSARAPWKEASRVSPVNSQAFAELHKTIRQIYPDVVVAPFVLVGSTDTIHYADLSQNIFRFIPARLSERDTKRFHGIDERIAKRDFLDIVRFYRQFILNTTSELTSEL